MINVKTKGISSFRRQKVRNISSTWIFSSHHRRKILFKGADVDVDVDADADVDMADVEVVADVFISVTSRIQSGKPRGVPQILILIPISPDSGIRIDVDPASAILNFLGLIQEPIP